MADHNNPQSRDEEILIATIDGTEYNKLPQSRMEELLLELKEVIEEGSGGGSVHFVVVEELPTTDIDQTAIYLVPKSTAATSNVYDEYINTDGTTSGWELIGSTDIDLSDYITDSDLATILEDYATEQDLSGKQDTLTAGSNIKINNNAISVNRWFIPAGKVVYTIITSDENYGQNVHIQRHTLDGAFIDDRTFLCEMYKTVNIDNLISIWNPYSEYRITLLEDSDEHTSGYSYTVNPISAATSNSFTFVMPQEENDNDLIIREELDAVSSAVSAIKDGQSIDSFSDVETALSDVDTAINGIKDGTDIDSFADVESALSDVADDVDELKSGLTNVNTALDVPAGTGKNLAFKMISKATINESGVIESHTAYNLFVAKVSNGETYTATKGGDYRVYAFYADEPVVGSTSYDGSRVVESDTSSSFTFTAPTNGYIAFRSNVAYTEGQLEKGSTATAYTPYIPSVDTRLDTLESDLTGVFTADLLYEGAPTQAETYEEKNLISGKSITDYLLILFVCRQYNNTVAFAIEPKHVFTQQTGDSSRVIFKYGDGTLQTVMVYYVSPTKIAVNQKTVDGTVWKTALYGIIKQP